MVSVGHPGVVQGMNDKIWGTTQEATDYLALMLGPYGEGTEQVRFTFNKVDRRGKFLLIHVGAPGEHDRVILSHLGFTGWWVPSWAEKTVPLRFLHNVQEKDVRIMFGTDKGVLRVIDPRALSRMRIYCSEEEALTSRHLVKMGPDADTPAAEIALANALPKTGRRIRDVIMDQQIVCGIGNYLCCEILYRALLHGHEKANKLTSYQKGLLSMSIKSTIQQACVEDSHDWWSVFRKKTCPKGHPITREDWGARGHYLCYECQGKPG